MMTSKHWMSLQPLSSNQFILHHIIIITLSLQSQYDDETEKKASKDGLKEEEDNTEGDDLEIPEDLKIEDEGQAEAGDGE